jgi:hypothetical protein
VAERLRVEKRKWDGTLSSVESALPLRGRSDALAWLVPRGTIREHPKREEREELDHDEVWLSVPQEWWVLCGYARSDGAIARYELHAAAPPEATSSEAGVVSWVDLDLDLALEADAIELNDGAQFNERARSTPYPDEVVRGAWKGISALAARYTIGEWPFDGWMDEELRRARAELVSGRAADRR